MEIEMDQNIIKANEIKAKTVIHNLERRGMKGFFCATAEEAREKMLELIPKGASVGWGGSLTLDQVGIKPALKSGDYQVVDRDEAQSPQERVKLMKRAMLCDVFLTSSNGITMDGELVNIDGNGNRLAAICYGPDLVLVVAGLNKLAANLEAAVHRVRMESCTANAVRFDAGTPCALTGRCGDCTGDNTICGQVLVTRRSKVPARIQVILVAEPLGF